MAVALKETSRKIIIGKILFKAFLFNKSMQDDNNKIPLSDLSYSFKTFLQKIKSFADEEKKIDLNEFEDELENLDKMHPDYVRLKNEIEENIKLCRIFTKNQIRIDEDKNRAIILFDYIDENGADVAYKNNKTLKIKLNEKEKYEGLNYSSHLVINLSDPNGSGIFNAALECVPQLSTTVINGVLSKICNLFRNRSKNDFLIDSPTGEKDKDGNYLKKSIRISIEFQPVPSEDFIQLLNNKKSILALSLIQSSFQNDTAPVLTARKQELFFSLPDDGLYEGVGIFERLKALFRWGNNNHYTQTKIVIKDESNINKTILIDNSSFLMMKESHIAKTKIINNLSKMPTGCDKINDEFVEQVWKQIQR